MNSQFHTKKAVFTGQPATLTARTAALSTSALALVLSAGAVALDPETLPSGASVAGGAVSISRSGARLDINQSTRRAVIDWRNFDIGAAAQVNFSQPGAAAIAVNRVNGSTDPTQINGGLSANGQVWVLNPNGVMFGAGARVDTAGLVAAAADIDVERFMAGDTRLALQGGGGGTVSNDGHITISEGGLAALVGPSVSNSGVIHARLGSVTLAAGETFTLDLAGDRLVEIGVGAEQAAVAQLGEVAAQGGVVTLSAKAAGGLLDSVINVTGVTLANSAQVVGGEIILDGGDIQIAGTLDASGAAGGGSVDIRGTTITTAAGADIRADALGYGAGGTIRAYAGNDGFYDGNFSARGGAGGGDGGFVETSGKRVAIAAGLSVDTLAPQGAAGTWSVDPDNLTVIASGGDGESTLGADTIVANLATTNVHLEAAESITIEATIDSSAQVNGNNLALVDENGDGKLAVNLNAGILLGDNQTLAGEASVVNVAATGLIQNGVDIANVNGLVNVAAGVYDENVSVHVAGVTVAGAAGATLTTGLDRETGFSISANDVTVTGMTVTGPFSDAFTDVDWSDPLNHNTAINVAANLAGIRIIDNVISDVRTGINLGSGAAVTVTGNLIENTKGSILVRTDLATIDANRRGDRGSEWDIVFFSVSDGAYTTSPFVDAAQYGADIMALSADNDGMWILDRRYGAGGFLGDTPAIGNRSHVTVWAGSTATAGDDFGLGNGLGNRRQPLATIGAGIDAVVNGGVVDVQAGAYAETLTLDKTVLLAGPQAGVDGRNRSGEEAVLTGSIFITGNAGGSTVDGLTLVDGGRVQGSNAGIYIGSGATDITIQNSVFSRFGAADGDGYRGILTTSGGDQGGLSIVNNRFAGWATGVYLNPGAAGARVLANDFDGNFVGMSIDGPQAAVVSGNRFTGSLFEGLGLGPGSATVAATISDNDFDANTTHVGLYTGAGTTVALQENRFDGVAVADMSNDQLLALAAKVGDGTDSAGAYAGFADLRDGYVVITAGNDIETGLGFAASGDTVLLGDGTYLLDSTLNIDTGLTLTGQSQAGTVIDGSAVNGYGVYVTADAVTLSDFTLYGPAGNSGGRYGIKVNPANAGAAGSRLTDFAIADVTIRGSGRAELDLNGVQGATIARVTADGRALADSSLETAGAGIQITDSADISLAGVTTLGNAWGGVALYQANRFFDQQTAGIRIDAATSTFAEAVGVFSQDSSDTLDFGTLELAGFSHVVRNPDHRPGGDSFTFFRTSQQDAIDFATGLAAPDSSYIEGWTGTATNGNFTVGTASTGDAMSIATAVAAAVAGNTVIVLDGTYRETVTAEQPLNFSFGDVVVGGLTLNGAGSSLSGRLASAGEGFRFNAPLLLAGDTALTATAAATIVAGAIDAASAGEQGFEVNAAGPVTLGALGASSRLGVVSIAAGDTVLAGDTYRAGDLTFAGPVTLTQASTRFDTGVSATAAGDIRFSGDVFGTVDGEQSIVLVAGDGNGSVNGDVFMQNAGTAAVRLGSMAVQADDFSAATVRLASTYDALLAGNQVFTDETLTAGGSVNSIVGGDAEGPIVSGGNIVAVIGGRASGSMTAAGDVDTRVAGDALLEIVSGGDVKTEVGGAVTGSIVARGSVDSTAQGDASVAITATTGNVVNNVGGNFDGSMLAGGQVESAVGGDAAIVITADGGVASSVGGNLDGSIVAGGDVESSATGDVAVAITAVTGNVVSAADGNMTGSIEAGGQVLASSGATLSGAIRGDDVEVAAGNVHADVTARQTAVVTAEQAYTGALSAGDSGFITAQTVDIELSDGRFVVDATTGTVTGNPQRIDLSGTGTLAVNGQVMVGSGEVNLNQIVVESFDLPQQPPMIPNADNTTLSQDAIDAIVARVAPAAAGDQSQVVFVRSVESLGELMAKGYKAIVIDVE
ncbi:filamentous hemagglutinin N-terminal domain-containing protein [Exilibacterium tricleocarpae]|uniref:Filamentous hemagglutinin N-terminal domain-containing protein n=1 Tax=Exilibacterium tricleocarpae TaxID=2591008 RepID=A0A545U9C3_9GAMM|nr:filamentous hemagglutinin N-terminal domain-containing protein [Exilibacterium tricleocarpae]TQV86067.1 filamentous hemagglutinin N-terminal domain-containing protein [Exilibacterium tricleocarpae]